VVATTRRQPIPVGSKGGLDRDVRELSLLVLATVMISKLLKAVQRRRPVEPGRRARRAPILFATAEHVQKHLLHGVLRLLLVAEQSQTAAIHHGAVAFEQNARGG
jgi:hypothetical protein